MIDIMELAPLPWRVGECGRVEDAKGQPVAWIAVRLNLGDDSWRVIANKLAAAGEMEAALAELAQYTFDILTGPIMQAAGVVWPEGGPQSPVLNRARAALAKAREDLVEAAAAEAARVPLALYTPITAEEVERAEEEGW
jgi:hypothetical protein